MHENSSFLFVPLSGKRNYQRMEIKFDKEYLRQLYEEGKTSDICQRPVHPGELLKEEIECRKLPQTKLAMQMGISYKVLNGILNCRRPLTTSTAMLFEAALGISAGLLMRMQLDCNMQQTANDKPFMERLNQIRKYAALL